MPTTRVSESRDREGRAGRFWRWAQHPAARTQMVNLQEKSWYFLGLPAVKGTSRPSVSRENQFSGPRAPAARSSAALPVGTAPPPPRVPPRLSFRPPPHKPAAQVPLSFAGQQRHLVSSSAPTPRLSRWKEHLRTQDPGQSDFFFKH